MATVPGRDVDGRILIGVFPLIRFQRLWGRKNRIAMVQTRSILPSGGMCLTGIPLDMSFSMLEELDEVAGGCPR
jgi:hypothetical protein